MPRFSRPTFGKNDVRLVELYRQKLKAKLVDILVKQTVKTTEDRMFAFAMFANEVFETRPEFNEGQEFSNLAKRMMDNA